jgi:hypothetical protein
MSPYEPPEPEDDDIGIPDVPGIVYFTQLAEDEEKIRNGICPRHDIPFLNDVPGRGEYCPDCDWENETL